MEWSNDCAPLLRLSVLPSCGESSKWYKWCKFRHGAMEWPRWLVSLMRPASANQRPGSRSRDHYRPIRAQETWSPEPEHYIIQTQWYSEYILDLHYHHNVLQKIEYFSGKSQWKSHPRKRTLGNLTCKITVIIPSQKTHSGKSNLRFPGKIL